MKFCKTHLKFVSKRYIIILYVLLKGINVVYLYFFEIYHLYRFVSKIVMSFYGFVQLKLLYIKKKQKRLCKIFMSNY